MPFGLASKSSVIINIETIQNKKEFLMSYQKSAGRPSKINYKIIAKLIDSIEHNSTISEACRYAGISRDTYYRHLKTNSVFAEKMSLAKNNQNKPVFSFLTSF